MLSLREAPLPTLAWPTQCAVCRGWSRTRVCADCLARHATPRWRCSGCALAVPTGVARCGACVTQPLPFARALAAVDYAYPWSALVGGLKFQGATGLAAVMAELIAGRVREAGREVAVDCVLPLPLGRGRLAERGMNQSWEIARRLARRLRLPADAFALQRRVETPHLADLPRAERARAIRGAFALAPGATTRLHGRRVALVDDVMTTGATAVEAAHTLLEAGVAAVDLWAFARTAAPDGA